MRAIKLITFTLFSLTGSLVFAQSDIFFTGQNNEKTVTSSNFLENKPDYRIINSNSSYIEIEFYPSHITNQKVTYNAQTFEVYDFQNSVSNDLTLAGNPDVRFRIFSIAIPSELNNTVQVTDFEVKEINNVNLAPIPFINALNPNVRGFENIYYAYIKGAAYDKNKFYPENVAALNDIGNLRELTTARLTINPFQYNPASGVLKVYSRIRVRVTFGTAPLPFNRPRTKEEINLLKGTVLNSDLALNWLNPKNKTEIGQNRVTSSVLSSGDWYKIDVFDQGHDGKSEGIYKITKSALQSAGVNLNGVDPRTIKMFGNGGYVLSENMLDPTSEDLQQIRIYFAGEEDGSFDSQDYILFFARGINNWNYDSASNSYNHYVDVFSNSNYYWI